MLHQPNQKPYEKQLFQLSNSFSLLQSPEYHNVNGCSHLSGMSLVH